MKRILTTLLAATLAVSAFAQEAAIRKSLAERMPRMKVDEVTKGPVPGLWEVRVGTDVFYTDEGGNYLIEGQVLDLKTRRNVTQERLNKLAAIDFDKLPLKDAFTIVRGDGKRKLALFEDPNCGYCRQFEQDLMKVDNVTVHVFLYPILGDDSKMKSRDIWCTKDRAKAWQDWMVRGRPAPAAPMPGCDYTALERNREFGKQYRINGTPTLVFANGTRVASAIPATEVEKLLAQNP